MKTREELINELNDLEERRFRIEVIWPRSLDQDRRIIDLTHKIVAIRNQIEKMDNTIILRANLLGGMNSYIIGLGDEEVLMPWLMGGVPDGATEDDLLDMAEDEETFNDCAILFARLLQYK